MGRTFSNAVLRLATEEAYQLPPITAYVDAGTNYTFDGGNSASMYSSLLKTGGGELNIETQVSVTGRLELADGTLRLAPVTAPSQFCSLAGGLWKAVVSQAETASTDYMNIMVYSSNDVVTCCDLMKTPTYPPWVTHNSVSWGGYVWNRSETNETWRFALGVSGYSRLWLDGTKILSTDDNGKVYFYNKTLSPGPHSFLLKVNPRNYGHPGSISALPGKNKEWKVGTMGIAISKTSTTSTNSDDFVFMENVGESAWNPGGNGYWFTCDTRDVGDFSADALASRGGEECRRQRHPYVHLVRWHDLHPAVDESGFRLR